MSSGTLRRASIGFAGGQVLPVRIGDDALGGLRKALGGDGWHALKTDEGEVELDLKKIVYLNVEADEHRIGFS